MMPKTAVADIIIPTVFEKYAIERTAELSSFGQCGPRTVMLPASPTDADLVAVALKLLPEQGERVIDYVVGYALTSRGFFQAIRDTADHARLIARKAGKEKPSFADVKAAVIDWRGPSDAAMQRVFASKPKGHRGVAEDGNSGAFNPPDNGPLNGASSMPTRAESVRADDASHGRAVVPAALPQDRCGAPATKTLYPVPG